jgi:hypothetical protein
MYNKKKPKRLKEFGHFGKYPRKWFYDKIKDFSFKFYVDNKRLKF